MAWLCQEICKICLSEEASTGACLAWLCPEIWRASGSGQCLGHPFKHSDRAGFNHSLDRVVYQQLCKDWHLATTSVKSLDGTTLPTSLRSLTLGAWMAQLCLQTLTFDRDFNQILDGNRRLDDTTLPTSLQNLTFGGDFNQSLDQVTLPASLQKLAFGRHFDQSLDGVGLPAQLQSLTSSPDYAQSLISVVFPAGLKEFDCQGLLVSCADRGERWADGFERKNQVPELQVFHSNWQYSLPKFADFGIFLRIFFRQMTKKWPFWRKNPSKTHGKMRGSKLSQLFPPRHLLVAFGGLGGFEEDWAFHKIGEALIRTTGYQSIL